MLDKLIADKRAFSLLELVIVIAIGGIIVGGIWLAMSNITQNSREARLLAQTTETMANARRIFGRVAELPNVNGTVAFTTASITAGVFPADMVRQQAGGAEAIHALGANAYLAYAFSGTPVLNLTFAGMRPESCSRLVTKVVGSAATRDQYGINALIIGARNIPLNNDVPVATLVDACNAGNGRNGFNMTFQFTIL